MAPWASCLIWLSNRNRALKAWFLVVGIASPTPRALIVTLATGSTHGHKIMGDDAPAKVSFKSNLALVKGPLHVEAVFERALAALQCRLSSLGHAETSAVSVALPG